MIERRRVAWRSAVIAGALILLALQAAHAVECRLAPDGSITTWLVSPPFAFDDEAGFEKDFLPRWANISI